MLIKLYKIWYLNLDKDYYFQETRLFVWKIENFDKLQLPQSLVFFAEILFILFRSWVINKNVKIECVEIRSFFDFWK